MTDMSDVSNLSATATPALPPGLVLWPACTMPSNRLCVLISDIHCTDCTVGNQTASETDWQLFFEQMEFAVCNPGDKAQPSSSHRVDELMLILNGDIVDLIRSSKWAQAGIYPWQRDDPRFGEIVLDIMRDIVRIHALKRPKDSSQPYTGFFYWMRKSLAILRQSGVRVSIIPIVGNHDKELQVVPDARQMFYEECLGLTAIDIPDSYRKWVAAQLGTRADELYPCLPFYVADTGMRLLATHGQWRDADNARATSGWRPGRGWAPDVWRKESYRAFSDPCFGDTVAAGMLSHFIWCTEQRIDPSIPSASRVCNLLDEMDLYRPSVAAVVRLLSESRRLARRDPKAKGLHAQVLQCFRESLMEWLGHEATWDSAMGTTRLGLYVLWLLTKPKWYWLDISLMRLMAKVQEPESSITDKDLLGLPAFGDGYRELGLRLHVEGHTHVALEADVQFQPLPGGRNNYTYVNLGAWRDAILRKRSSGFRRRGIGRALFVFHLGKLPDSDDSYRFYTRDMISWSDRLDSW